MQSTVGLRPAQCAGQMSTKHNAPPYIGTSTYLYRQVDCGWHSVAR